MERLDGKKIIITGGTSGMGEGIVRAFPSLGAKVVFWGRNTAAGEKIAAETGACAICCDVSDGAAVRAAFERLPDVDILVCNAGICHTGLIV